MDIYGNEAYNIRHTLEKVAEALQGILRVMKKPENRFTRIFQYIIFVVGALELIHLVEVVRQWIVGG